jgi:hypothetical protein
MKNHLIIAFLFIVFAPKLSAQIKRDSSLYKNEIGIDIIPLFKIFSEPSTYHNTPATIQYKRRVNSSFYIRATFSYSSGKRANISPLYIVGDRDSSNWSVQSYQTFERPAYDGKLGGEYRWGKHRLKFFTGMDIGYYYSSYMIRNDYGVSPKSEPLTGPSQIASSSFQDTLTTKSIIATKNYSCNPFFGIQFHFSKHFFFSTQLGTVVFVNLSKVGNATNTSMSSTSRYLINNFLLCYRF